MKMILITVLMSLCVQSSFAGQVLTLQPGETLPLNNGDVVACQGDSYKPQRQVVCSLGVDGFTPFKGYGPTEKDAKAEAYMRCVSYISRQVRYSPTSMCDSFNTYNKGYTCRSF